NDDDEAHNNGTNIYISDVAASATAHDLITLFATCGTVRTCNIVPSPKIGPPRRIFAFVTMATADEADRAIATIDGQTLAGKSLHLEKAFRAYGRKPTPGRYLG
ncbi:putative transformer-SR ribonucleo protein, partial [Eremomyces bilateralis CBS 781.70]